MRKSILSLIYPSVFPIPLFAQHSVSSRVIATDGSALCSITIQVKGSQTVTQTGIAIKFRFLEKL